MRRLLVLLALFATLCGCGGDDRGTAGEPVRLALVEPGSSRELAVRAWALGSAGRVVALGGTPGELLVAQRLGLSRLEPDGSTTTALEPPPGSQIAALSRHGRRIAIEDDEGIRVGRITDFDPDSTALSAFGSAGEELVLDGYPARIFQGRLWDLDVPRMVWTPRAFGEIAAIDPAQRRIAIGEEEGGVAVLSALNGRRQWSVPRRAPGSAAQEIAALAVSPTGEVASLDRAGWVSCGSGAAPALPLAAPGMPAAIAFANHGLWITRGATAAFFACDLVKPHRICEIRGADGDPRSAALITLHGRVYAAGMRRNRIVVLPRCR